MTTFFRIFAMLWLAIACIHTAVAKTFMPIISHYSPLDYRMGLQNWACTQDSRGTMYFGNNDGILAYDGYSWHTAKLPSRGIVRALLADGERVYAGGYTDFGYFRRDSIGTLRYHSLWPKNYKTHDDEVWNIVKDGLGNIWFQSFSSYFCYDGSRVRAYYNKEKKPLWFFNVRGTIYAQVINGGLCRMTRGTLLPVAGRETFGGDNVVGLHPYGEKGMLAATASHGLYILEGSQAKKLNTDADALLRQSIINRTIQLSPRTLVAGTIKGGVMAIDIESGRCLWHYDRGNGLGNNTVLGLFAGRAGNVWVALDNGLSLIHTALPVEVARLDGIGMVYGMTMQGDIIYLATNQAVWRYAAKTASLTQVTGCEGQNWYVESFGGDILAGNNMGMRAVKGTEARSTGTPAVGSTALREYNLFGQRALIETSYTAVRIYREAAGRWKYAGEIKGFNSPVREFEIDSRGVIWAAHMSKGMYQLELSRDLTHFTSVRYYPSLGNGSEQAFHVMSIGGRVVFAYSGSLYTYDDIARRIVPYDNCGKLGDGSVVTAAMVDKNTFWMLDTDGYWLMHNASHKCSPRLFIPNSMFGQQTNTYGRAMYVAGQQTYFFLNDGLGRYDTTRPMPSPANYRLFITSVTTRDHENNIRDLRTDQPEDVNGNITIGVSYPNYDNDRLTFVYTLQHRGKTTTETSATPSVTYSNLAYGDYQLQVSVRNVAGKTLSTATYTFYNPTPFYISVWAWLAYIAAAWTVVFYYTRWRTARVVRRNRKEAERELMQQKMKTLEQERIIAEQQQRLLESELQIKGKDVASMAFDMVAMKNSMESVREQLLEGMRNGTLSSKKANQILQQLKDNDTEMFWSTYHNNFDLIHKNFFRNLHARYPMLTQNDMKICALLRLNLNTKDIAGFTHLSVRGVEGARYRLRKKLGIPTDKSLNDFLLEF